MPSVAANGITIHYDLRGAGGTDNRTTLQFLSRHG
jgi:hypothetical protein